MTEATTGKYISELSGGLMTVTNDKKIIIEGVDTGYTTIQALANFFNKHTHGNKDILDQFSVSGDQLLYNGQPVGGVSYKGYFPNASSLQSAFPSGQDGWYASVGATNTMWLWDSDTSSWVDSGSAISGTAAEIHAAPTKSTPANGDEFGYADSENSYSLKKLTWNAIKTALKSFFDTVYQAAGDYVTTAMKGVAGGVAPLDSDNKIPAVHIPDLAITNVITSAESSLSDFIANEWPGVSIQTGDVVQITEADGTVELYILFQNDGDEASDYKRINASKIDWGNVINKPDLVEASQIGAANGVAPLDADSKVPVANLPDLGGSGSALPLQPAAITLWSEGDYRDGQVKTTVAAYYDDDTKHLEQRFDWNTDMSVSRIEIKDELTGVWVQRDYTWAAGIPAVAETTITAWTII